MQPRTRVKQVPTRGAVGSRVSIAGVCERDIDLLLLEELHASPDFRRWFANQVVGSTKGKFLRFVDATNSIDQPLGESDLEVRYEDLAKKKLFLLLENKINAGFQPQQQQRYRDRGEAYIRRGECDEFRTVLLAPKAYLGEALDAKGFDGAVSYEAIRDWFLKRRELGKRREYKVSLLDLAIEKGCLGYQVREDERVSEFWQCYWRLAQELAPELEMPEPPPKPAGSGWAHFHPAGLPKGVKLIHKMPRRRVDLQFSRKLASVAELIGVFGQHLPPGVRIVNATNSAAVRITTPLLNVQSPFSDQVEAVRKGLDAAKQLYAWFMGEQPLWARKVTPTGRLGRLV